MWFASASRVGHEIMTAGGVWPARLVRCARPSARVQPCQLPVLPGVLHDGRHGVRRCSAEHSLERLFPFQRSIKTVSCDGDTWK